MLTTETVSFNEMSFVRQEEQLPEQIAKELNQD
jgi:hypothetical protein